MSDIQLFQSDEFGVLRASIDENGEPWFIARDVCDALELDSTATRRLDKEEKGLTKVQTHGGVQSMATINESGLYTLMVRSNKASVRPFRKWVTSEVLPSIRRTGGYMVAGADETPEQLMARALKVADDTIRRVKLRNEALEAEVDAMRPKATFADAVSASRTSILVGELAKILRQNGVVDMGQNRLFAWMRENGYLIRRKGSDWNMPTQRSMEMGLFEVKETAITHSDGHTSISKTVKVTGRGQQYFIAKFLGRDAA